MAPIPIPTALPADSINSQTIHSQIFSLLRRADSSIISLLKRQSIVAIPATYGNLNDGPPPGTIAGIVLGSVGGFLLILWLLYTCFGGGGFNSGVSEASSVVIRERRKSTRGSSRARSRRHSETVEVRRPPVVERVVVEERRREREVRSESSGGEDEVVVIEEHSPPRRSKSKRESGYRTVDPLAYGGGDRPLREVRKSSSRRSRG